MSISVPDFQFSLIEEALVRGVKSDLNPHLVPDLGYPDENPNGPDSIFLLTIKDNTILLVMSP